MKAGRNSHKSKLLVLMGHEYSIPKQLFITNHRLNKVQNVFQPKTKKALKHFLHHELIINKDAVCLPKLPGLDEHDLTSTAATWRTMTATEDEMTIMARPDLMMLTCESMVRLHYKKKPQNHYLRLVYYDDFGFCYYLSFIIMIMSSLHLCCLNTSLSPSSYCCGQLLFFINLLRNYCEILPGMGLP